MVLEDFGAVLKRAKAAIRIRRVVVAGAADDHVIDAVLTAENLGIAEPVLIGNKSEISALLTAHGATAEDFTIIDAQSAAKCGELAVEQVKAGKADFIMKGMIETRDILKPLVKKENWLHTGRTMSHVGFFGIPGAKKLMIITDGGMLITPTLEEKRDIINNAVSLLCDIGYKTPSVAVLCAVETVNPKMVETTDAKALVEMNRAREIPNCTVVGPISYDLVMSSEIAQIKHYDCPHCGDFDILVAPTMACGNILAKSWILTAGAEMAGLIVGAKVPVVLNSRGSSAQEKLYSMALAAISSPELRKKGEYLMRYKILVINPGSTSTKIAVYENEHELWSYSILHSTEDLLNYHRLFDQLIMRYEKIVDTITSHNIPITELSAVVGRGGLLPPVKSGAYLVNRDMLMQLEEAPILEHAANLGAPLAFRVAEQLGIPAYIYDPVTVDEMIDVVRITGRKSIKRFGKGHNLNMRAAALRYARENDLDYQQLNLVVTHLGGGITSSLHSKGCIADMISDDEGAFSPERAGGLPVQKLISECFKSGATYKEMMRKIQRQGGLVDHLFTTDLREVERRILEGDKYAKLVYDAMALNVSKDIARLSTVVNGQVDAIILTGGIAYSQLFTAEITERVKWIAPVKILAGENEMEALAHGALRVLQGEEQTRTYTFQPLANC